MSPLLLAALLALYPPAPRSPALVTESSVGLMLDAPAPDARPARTAVIPRPGARVLARRR